MVENDAKLSQNETIHDAPLVGVVPSKPVHVGDEIPDAEVSKNEIQNSGGIVDDATATKAKYAKSVQEFASVTPACDDDQVNAQKSILKASSMNLKAESLNHQNSETTNALPLNPHETKNATLTKTTGKENCKESEDENFFKNILFKMIAMFFDNILMKQMKKQSRLKASSIPGQVLEYSFGK